MEIKSCVKGKFAQRQIEPTEMKWCNFLWGDMGKGK